MNYWWIPITIASSIFTGFLSFKIYATKCFSWGWILWVLNIIPLWIFIAKYSKNILFDGLVYDIITTVVYTTTVMLLVSDNEGFTTLQWVSLILILVGLLMFKIGDFL